MIQINLHLLVTHLSDACLSKVSVITTVMKLYLYSLFMLYNTKMDEF